MHIKNLLIYFFVLGLLLLGPLAQAQLTMPSGTNDGIEARVDAYFIDTPEMIAIAKCESGFRQFNNFGTPLAGGSLGNYIGVFQISKGHAIEASAMGMDIYTTDGNLAYARYLYQTQGTTPWSGCASVPVDVQIAVTPPATSSVTASTSTQASVSSPVKLTLNLKIGITSPEVTTLQQLLNAAGFTVAISGPGSKGNETSRFGSLTQAAVQRFQCKKNIACSGNEATTGYGLVGPKTRAALLKPV